MKFLSGLCFTVCVMSIVYTALMMLAPDRFRREIKGVFALVAVITVFSSFLHADLSDISEGLAGIDFERESYSRDELVKAELEERVAEYIKSFLAEEGIECKKISVRTTIDEQRRISISEASLEADLSQSGAEDLIRSLIAEKIGGIEVNIIYGEE